MKTTFNSRDLRSSRLWR